jgi:hypothetical protein
VLQLFPIQHIDPGRTPKFVVTDEQVPALGADDASNPGRGLMVGLALAMVVWLAAAVVVLAYSIIKVRPV